MNIKKGAHIKELEKWLKSLLKFYEILKKRREWFGEMINYLFDFSRDPIIIIIIIWSMGSNYFDGTFEKFSMKKERK